MNKAITITLATMPNQPQKLANAGEPENQSARGIPHLGLSVAPASDVAGASSKRVAVTGVDPDGAAAEHGLQSGDVILDVSGKSVGTTADLSKALSENKIEWQA